MEIKEIMIKIFQKIGYKFKKMIAEKKRHFTSSYSYDEPFTIISCNCIGGMVYHDLKMPFSSPTINLYIPSGEFIRFVADLKNYLAETPIEEEALTNKMGFPVLLLKDIHLYCKHYPNVKEAIVAFERRKTRVNYDNIFVILSDRDGFEDSMIKDFDKLPYRKLIYTSHPLESENVVLVKKDQGKKEVDDLTKFYDFKGERVYEHDVDLYQWLTGKYTLKECLKHE